MGLSAEAREESAVALAQYGIETARTSVCCAQASGCSAMQITTIQIRRVVGNSVSRKRWAARIERPYYAGAYPLRSHKA